MTVVASRLRNLIKSCHGPAIAVRRTASLPLAYVLAIHVSNAVEKPDVDARDIWREDALRAFARASPRNEKLL
jgi:hypothetical protein